LLLACHPGADAAGRGVAGRSDAASQRRPNALAGSRPAPHSIQELTMKPAFASLLIALAGAAAFAQGTPSEGEVRKVDKGAKKITLKHGEIKNLDMPPMSMVFQVRDPAMLDRVKAGDKVRFTADKVDGAYTLTSIELAK
jgi:Cu(I)/Ag(I) efflux system protein CusF